MRNEEILHRVKEKRNILHTVKGRKADWIGHILRRNCFIKHAIGGNTEEKKGVTRIRGRRCNQLLDYLKEKIRQLYVKRGSTISHCLERSVWNCYESVVRQTTKCMNG